MLTPRARGFTLLEVLVSVAIVALLLALGAPAFSTWVASARIRSTAESTLAGLQLARSEATTRNAQVRFQFTTSLDGLCALSAAGPDWLIDMVTTDASDAVETRCDSAADDSVAPHILHKNGANQALGSTVINSGLSSFVFNGVGRLVNPPAATVDIDFQGPNPASCRPTGELACLRIQVSPAGQIRLCNPALAGGTAQACS